MWVCSQIDYHPLMNHHFTCKVAKLLEVYLWRSTVVLATCPCISPYLGHIPMPHALSTLTHSKCASARRRAKLHRWQAASRDPASSMALEDCFLTENCVILRVELLVLGDGICHHRSSQVLNWSAAKNPRVDILWFSYGLAMDIHDFTKVVTFGLSATCGNGPSKETLRRWSTSMMAVLYLC
jgi:hypothetical protein